MKVTSSKNVAQEFPVIIAFLTIMQHIIVKTAGQEAMAVSLKKGFN